MLVQSTQTNAPAQVISPIQFLPEVLATMPRETISAHIDAAKHLMQVHRDIARNGEPDAAHYYFFIPEVARDMASARYTLAIMFAEIRRRNEFLVIETPAAAVA